jgi:5-methyltetrahydrofolate--homocysteine methyltransferase
MEETIRQLRSSGHPCFVMVGGAVLTKEYAEKIGAHHYAKDAMECVRYAQVLMDSRN